MELVDLYDENRVPLGRTAERYGKKGPGEYRVVVHVCVFDHQGRLLIQQRTPEKILWPDRVGCVHRRRGGCRGDQPSGPRSGSSGGIGISPGPCGKPALCDGELSAGFDDFYIAVRDLDLGELTLQKEEVRAVRWATREEVLALVESGAFIPYPKSFVEYLFDTRETFGFPGK